MKYWNKERSRKNWHRVVPDRWYPKYQEAKLKRWCQLQSSKGRFYIDDYSVWYFEQQQDAVLFMLKWL